ncbi:MAG TPA: hypothetical protein VK711_17100 [Puia sp.]|nr:hypothetical protein [Puia sp.]
MLQKIALTGFSICYSCIVFSQSFKQGIGMTVMFQPVHDYRVVGSVGFIYSPKYVFNEKEDSYLSLGIPMTLAFSRLDDSNSVDLKLGIMVNLPLIFNYNYQPQIVDREGSRFGYFAGGGFGFHANQYTAANDEGTITQQINGLGPVVNAGVRYAIVRRRVHTLEIRISYMKLFNANHTDIFGVGCLFNF